MDSTEGVLEEYTGNYESLKKTAVPTKIASAFYFSILQHRQNLEQEIGEDEERFPEHLNFEEELNPISKPKKKAPRKKTDDDSADEEPEEDPEEEEDPLAYEYTYYGVGKVKGPDGKMVEVTGPWKKKKFLSMSTQVKHALHYILQCMVHECKQFYDSKGRFPDEDLISEIKEFANSDCVDAIFPFVVEVSSLELGRLLEEEPPEKGVGALRKHLETEFKKIFESTSGTSKPNSKPLLSLIECFVNFIKVLSVFVMEYMWENKTAFNLKGFTGTLRQLSRIVTPSGGSCPQTFYQSMNMYIEQNTNTASATKGKGAGASKGKGAGAGASKGKGATKGSSTTEETSKPGPSVDEAMEELEGDDNFGEGWEDDAMPSDEE